MEPIDPKVARRSLTFIFITLLIDVSSLGLVIPVFPEIIEQLSGGGISDASRWGGWLTMAYAVTQFLMAPVIGGLSDQYGRRPVLLASLLAFGLDYLLLAIAPTLWWLFIGRIIAGVTGASITTASAYIADISTPEKRAQNFGMIGAAFGVGFILGPSIGGLLGSLGPRVPFYVAAAMCLANAIYGYFVLPESLKPENRRPFNIARANPVGTLISVSKYKEIAGLIASIALIYVAAHAVQSNWSFYTIEKFKWDSKMVGFSLGFIGLVVGLVQGLLIRWIIPKIGQNKAIYIGLFLYAFGFTLFALANAGWMMFAFMIPYALGGIAGPALQGYMSSHIPANAQGELQGALASLQSLSAIVGPPLMTNLFAHYTSPTTGLYFPGAPFVAAAILTLVSAVLAFRLLKPERKVVAQNGAESPLD